MTSEILNDTTDLFYSKNLKEEYRARFVELIRQAFGRESLYLGSRKIANTECTNNVPTQCWFHFFELIGDEDPHYVQVTRISSDDFEIRSTQLPEYFSCNAKNHSQIH